MTDASSIQEVEFLEHRGYQIRLSQSGPEWMAFVTLPTQRLTLIMAMAPDRQSAINQVHEWGDLQLVPDKTRE